MSTHAPVREYPTATGGEPPDAAVVELAGVQYRFGSGTGLVDLQLSVRRGSITVMVGPNGAGKTTALRIITGALVPQAGTARVFGPTPSRSDGAAAWWRPSRRCTTG